MITISTEIPQVALSYKLNAKAHKQTVDRVLQSWVDMNIRYFDGVFAADDFPVVVFEPLTKTVSYGSFGRMDESGQVYTKITLCKDVLNGTHPLFRAEKEFKEGRIRFLEDTLLHEMIHHFVEGYAVLAGNLWVELLKKDVERMVELGNSGAGFYAVVAPKHGIAFCHKANQIAELLGLPKVRIATADEIVWAAKEGVSVEPDDFGETPLCDHFPEGIRPDEYYLGCRKTALDVV